MSKAKRKAARPSSIARRSRSPTPKIADLKLAPPSNIRIKTLGANKAPKAAGENEPSTVIYVHGINNKPPASVLKCQWDTALFNTRLGDRSRMAYWVNRDFYPTPLDETCAEGDVVNVDDEEMTTRAVMALARGESGTERLALKREIEAMTDDPARQAWLKIVADKMIQSTVVSQHEMRSAAVRAKVLLVPPFLRRLITEKITRAFLRDVHDFLFVKERRDAMEQTLIDRLAAGGGPFVVIAHSQGSMIAYDVLRQLDPNRFKVPLFVTIGSPLGLQEVQDALRQWAGAGGRLPFPSCVKRWVNVADRLDPVAFDVDISDEFQGSIENPRARIQLNPDSPRHPHSATGYLKTEEVRTPVREVLGSAFRQSVTRFAIAKDLVGDIEDSVAQQRHSTLIQLSGSSAATERRELKDVGAAIQRKLTQIITASGDDPVLAEVEVLRHFIAAKLTRLEVETLRSYFDDLQIAGIWRNAKKRALINSSSHTIQVRPANLGYGADGKDICWAVLDTGIRANHPHFKKNSNVELQWDCTKRGPARKLDSRTKESQELKEFNELDKDGHGTHVAGIIAGEFTVGDTLFAGMAPRCKLYGFKVLNDNGDGDDGWIIKALDKIAELNEQAGALVVHGVNLSLGGSFDPEVFGCGHTPLCQELRRLWRQGVLVCLAAGNEGYAVLRGEEGNIETNMDLSIGDPANLDEAIAVGSVHKVNPHTYGISYFSSRGPTADGRRKPDVVAPGERIFSARHDWESKQRQQSKQKKGKELPARDTFYIEMSGTSMATPHVSGLLAAFLSLRREFVGYPDRVKNMLLNGCVDLARDPYMQGWGLPNLIKMLALN